MTLVQTLFRTTAGEFCSRGESEPNSEYGKEKWASIAKEQGEVDEDVITKQKRQGYG